MKRPTRGLIALLKAKGAAGPSAICKALNAVGGTYSQTSISLWLHAWRIPNGDARTHICMAYGIPESLWTVPVDIEELEKVAA